MGAFDDAIREHLELKRKQGAPEEELKQKEEEALGRGPARFAQAPAPAEPTAEEVLPADEPAPPVDVKPTPAEAPEGGAEVARAALAEPEEIPLEPDEVLPEEALEPSIEEDVLEETPDFLEESPDQDSLWFEQRRPKDFDFGD
jgi:hypothetical protein